MVWKLTVHIKRKLPTPGFYSESMVHPRKDGKICRPKKTRGPPPSEANEQSNHDVKRRRSLFVRRNGKLSRVVTNREETPEPTPFRFLDLPDELRDHVYRYCISNRKAYIVMKGKSRGTVVSEHGLGSVNRQIRHDFAYLLAREAHAVVARITDFNPHAISRFFKLYRTNNTPGRRLIIYLSITPGWQKLVDIDAFERSVRWFSDQSAAEGGFDVRYRAEDYEEVHEEVWRRFTSLPSRLRGPWTGILKALYKRSDIMRARFDHEQADGCCVSLWD